MSVTYRRTIILFIALLPITSRATTVTVLVTQHGTVVATDSRKSTWDGTMSRIGEGDTAKFVLVQNRIIVANVGKADIRRGETHYNFLTWMDNLQRSLPNGATVDQVASTINSESAKMFANFDTILPEGFMKPKGPLQMFEPFNQYVVIGYQDAVPRVIVVQYYINWNDKKLIGPTQILLDPAPDLQGDVRVHAVGVREALTDISDPRSYAFKQAIVLCPKAFADLLAGHDVPIEESIELARALIKIEENTNPGDVGGIIRIARILPDGRAEILSENTRIPKRSTRSRIK